MMMAFAIFDTKKHKRVQAAIGAMEIAVEGKRAEVIEAEDRLRATLVKAKEELDRPPPAGALAWRGHNGR